MKEIKYIDIKSLKLLERNPRKITKDAMTKLCESLIKDPNFLESRPVLVYEVEDLLAAGFTLEQLNYDATDLDSEEEKEEKEEKSKMCPSCGCKLK